MSKKIIFLAFVSAGVLFSCTKANIQPQADTKPSTDIPAWRSSVTSSNAEYDDGTTQGLNDRMEDVKKEFDPITDPNNDEDRNKKKKGNN